MNSENQTETMSPDDSATERMPLELLASRFVDEHRRWMNPSVEAYADAYPEHAAEIRESFPVLIAMEQWKGNQEYTSLRKQLPDPSDIRQLGDCRIIREISRSRTSILYEAVQGKLNRPVIVKLLPWKSEMTPRWRERFEREARLVSRLRHPNIVSFYNTGEDQGYCYSVMQLVNGVGLDQIIQHLAGDQKSRPHEPGAQTTAVARTMQQHPWRNFASIGLQAAQALSYAHNRKILHHDLKPENLLIDAAGHTWITNFSLAQVAEGALKQQSAKTLCYQAPERFLNQNHAQSDIYSLGIVLYELATRALPFQSHSSSELVAQITHQEPMKPREQNPSIPPDFETIILNCIAKSKQQRYRSAEALSGDLVRFINGRHVKRRNKNRSLFKGNWFAFWKR
tara:strand:- start:6629 stop:7819 length:1191 start_codon:yes stop_codon:yes gene_type:complete